MKTLASYDSVTILSASNGWATAINNGSGNEFKIRYSQKRKFIEDKIGCIGELTGTSYDEFVQLSAFFDLKPNDILTGINAAFFFPCYTKVKNFKHKLRGVDGNGKQIDFSADEKKEIIEGVKNYAKYIASSLK
jgi:hypothetical protein